ncbi:MAG: site-specific DNA-methyltransferase [Nodularia sp. (in: cyanobacteria)]|nr:site-specific DNA-methyltransferase [Nodularia sp. (in: cyanobacteria)]
MPTDPNLSLLGTDVPFVPSSVQRITLYEKFKSKIIHNSYLDRTLVSFQANKQSPFSSWFKYREGFSERLVTYLLQEFQPQPGIMLDPFSGSGSSLFAANALSWQIIGIEVLPVGIFATKARIIAHQIDVNALNSIILQLKKINLLDYYDERYKFKHLKITHGAFSPENEAKLVSYISFCYNHVFEENIQNILIYAAFCILEDISYTRKDGQYLRWDNRSSRSPGKNQFNKGEILNFEDAIYQKLKQISSDLVVDAIQLGLFDEQPVYKFENCENIKSHLYQTSCLETLPTLPENSIDFVVTSPPYANRYDYTRTYALELAFLGCGDEEVKHLRQTMLSCTVENREKRNYLENFYINLKRDQDFLKIETTFQNQAALQEILIILETYKKQGKLNNNNIAKMVRNYFYEMCFVIYELARVLKVGGIVAMINDNVRYAGEEIPVDLILSDIAEKFGLQTRYIWTLGRGKGNSSQQMGHHGRSELRKCVYIWEKQLPCP